MLICIWVFQCVPVSLNYSVFPWRNLGHPFPTYWICLFPPYILLWKVFIQTWISFSTYGPKNSYLRPHWGNSLPPNLNFSSLGKVFFFSPLLFLIGLWRRYSFLSFTLIFPLPVSYPQGQSDIWTNLYRKMISYVICGAQRYNFWDLKSGMEGMGIGNPLWCQSNPKPCGL